MKKTTMRALLLSAAILVATGPTGITAATPVQEGNITISGAWALYPMVVKWVEEFQKLYPKVKIDVSAGGAGKGIADTIAGIVDLGMVSREIHPEEVQKGAWFVAVTKDAVVPTFNAANPMLNEILSKGLSKGTLAKLWLDETERTWEELLGRTGSTQVHVYTRSDSCGAAETWAMYFGKKQEDLVGIGVYGDPGLTEAVKKDQLGIGFNNINYAYDASSKAEIVGIRILPIDINGNGKIDKDENFYANRDNITKAIADDKYPSPPARDLYLVAKGQPSNPLLKSFLSWVLQDGQKFVPETGYINLSAKKLEEGLKKLGK